MPIAKGCRVGVLGAGQLGRMLALAGYPLGHQFAFSSATPDEPACLLGQVYDNTPESLQAMAQQCDVMTYESENTPVELVDQLNTITPVYPSAPSLYYAQNRGREKALFTELAIPCAPYQCVNNLDDLKKAIEAIGLPAVLKTTTEGYDGKGQFVIQTPAQSDQAWLAIGEKPAILEGFISFKRELSMIAVRNADNQQVYYPLVENQHHDGILRLTLAPASQIDPHIQQQAQDYMQALLNKMNHVGVLTLELFETENGLIANEMAPRVHNSGHWTIEGARTSQFENHIRAITGLPLGATTPRQPYAAMINIIGEYGDLTPAFSMPNVHVHLYDKTERPARKIGHITVLAQSQAELDNTLQSLSQTLHLNK
ncbi:5-(carboxyamino)imidazole ribonucleotide synthase [Thiomicrospira microaerophila]|uniref:5-(carboxyamino)imidazole ribonucleotide synthase n=1 Tax=Thiomicrospira microaerophila TaxID=406020 RepID=UPI0005CA1241|nr:5-(carboxyamino)imidazole ribonucleotide synthase [Thiomicrospira microaerophila]